MPYLIFMSRKPIKTFVAGKPHSLVVLFFSLFFLVQCQFIAENDQKVDGFPKKNTFMAMDDISQLSGSVRIRLEPHGSVRATVYAKGQQQFEYILDRETPQELLTENVEKAAICVLRLKNTCFIIGLAIDDLATGKRYVLDPDQNCCGWARQQAEKLPITTTRKPIFINGYAGSITQSGMRFEDPL